MLLANAICAVNRLSQCCIEAPGCRHLALALEKNPEHLKVLDLSVNLIRDKGANEIFDKFNISKLRTLECVQSSITVFAVCCCEPVDANCVLCTFSPGYTTAASLS